MCVKERTRARQAPTRECASRRVKNKTRARSHSFFLFIISTLPPPPSKTRAAAHPMSNIADRLAAFKARFAKLGRPGSLTGGGHGGGYEDVSALEAPLVGGGGSDAAGFGRGGGHAAAAASYGPPPVSGGGHPPQAGSALYRPTAEAAEPAATVHLPSQVRRRMKKWGGCKEGGGQGGPFSGLGCPCAGSSSYCVTQPSGRGVFSWPATVGVANRCGVHGGERRRALGRGFLHRFALALRAHTARTLGVGDPRQREGSTLHRGLQKKKRHWTGSAHRGGGGVCPPIFCSLPRAGRPLSLRPPPPPPLPNPVPSLSQTRFLSLFHPSSSCLRRRKTSPN